MTTFTFNPATLTRRALIFFATLTCALTAALFFANTSHALDIDSGQVDHNTGGGNTGGGTGGSSSGGSSNPNTGGGNGGNTSSGGGSSAPNAPCGVYVAEVEDCWAYRTYSGSYGVTDGKTYVRSNFPSSITITQKGLESILSLGNKKCRATKNQRETNAGFTFSANYKHNLLTKQTRRISWSLNCSPLKYTDVTVKCYIDTSAVLNKVTAPKKTIARGGADIRGTGANEYEACRNVRTARVAMKTTVKELGRYQLDLSIRYRVNKYRVFGVNSITGRVAKPVRKSRGAVKTVTKRTYGQLTCDPATTSTGTVRSRVFRGNPSWTHDDCLTGGKPRRFEVKCSPTGRTQINGANRRTASIFRDGEDNSVKWAKPGIKATTRGSLKAETMFRRTGSPWDTPKNLPNKSNNVILRDSKGASLFSRNAGTGWVGGLIYDTDFSSTWASKEGDPTKITPTYRWTGQFAVTGWRITGFDPLTGVMTIRDTVTYTKSTVKCTGDTVSITSLRGVDAIG